MSEYLILKNIAKHITLEKEEATYFLSLLESKAVKSKEYILPLLKLAGLTKPGDAAYEEVSYPIAHRVLTKCDAVLRIEGASNGADIETAKAKEMGLEIYYSLEDIPDISE